VKYNFPCHCGHFPWHSMTRQADVTIWANSITVYWIWLLEKGALYHRWKLFVEVFFFFQIILSITLAKTVTGTTDFPSSYNHKQLCYQFCCHICDASCIKTTFNVAFQSYLYFKKCKYLEKIRQAMMVLAFYCAPKSGFLLVHSQLRMVISSKTI